MRGLACCVQLRQSEEFWYELFVQMHPTCSKSHAPDVFVCCFFRAFSVATSAPHLHMEVGQACVSHVVSHQ